ncbi:hypothetical protein KIW84_042066 [Lathyrus oleraceus]|uniref:Uncharacterized protein n=1 Tax=Pisum sativum TaxID=3888 RepID=A0A9D5ASX3_PEA|nr:hypothetical protein KIW84_042066 [Pisum sativum]
MSSAYYPESDGKTEVMNQCLKLIRGASYTINPYDFGLLGSLSRAAKGNKGGGCVEGVDRSGEALRQLRAHLHKVVERELTDCDEALRQLRAHLQRAQDRMKFQVDKKRTDMSLEVGE